MLETVQRFFDAIADRDAEAALAVMIPEGRFFSLREENSETALRTFTAQEFAHGLETQEQELLERIIRELLGSADDAVWIEPPFHCDYGSNITLGSKVFFNFNCVILDPAPVLIGSNVLFGPAVQVYTATHPISATERRTGREFARPVEVGSDVWVGGGAIICPGVRIGSRSIIGAGSVVTRDIPADVFASGNPCRIIRQLDD